VSYDSEEESSHFQTDESESEDEPFQPEPAMNPKRTHENLNYSDGESSDDSTSEFEPFDLPTSISSRPSKMDFSDLAQFYTPPPIKKKKPKPQRDPNPHGITCPQGHDLKFDNSHMKVCSSCKKTVSSGYTCKCDFVLCEDCYEMVHAYDFSGNKAPTTTKSKSTRKKPAPVEPMETPAKKKKKPKRGKRRGRKAPPPQEPEPVPEFLQKNRKPRKRRRKKGKKKVQEVMVSPDAVETSLDDELEISVDIVKTPAMTNPSRESSPQPPSANHTSKYAGLSLSDSGSSSGLNKHPSASYSRPSSNNPASSQLLLEDLRKQISQLVLSELSTKIDVLSGASNMHMKEEALQFTPLLASNEPDMPPVLQGRPSKSRVSRTQLLHTYSKEQSTRMSNPRTSAPVESPPPSSLPTNASGLGYATESHTATRSSSSPNCQPIDGVWDWVGSEGLDRYLAHIGHGFWSRTYISWFGQERLHLRMTERTCTCTRMRSSTNKMTTTFRIGEPQTFSNFQGEEITLRPGSTYKDGILYMDFQSKHGDSQTKRYVDANGDLVWETDFTGNDEAQTKLKFKLWYGVAQF